MTQYVNHWLLCTGAAEKTKEAAAAAAVSKLDLKGKQTQQGSEGWNGKPEKAVDGNTDGTYGHNSCTHTQNNDGAWWSVDLGQSYSIQEVVVWNRSDCCHDRLNGVEVRIDSQPCGTISAQQRENKISCGGKTGSKINIKSTRNDYLSLCEVEVYAGAAAAAAAAVSKLDLKGKQTQQGSEGWNGKPEKAVDGNTDGTYGHNSCTHTQNNDGAWWSVDLGQSYSIQEVVVWNRSDCCHDRLNGVEVRIDSQPCGTISAQQRENKISCGGKTGSKINIKSTRNDYLTLCEVEVYEGDLRSSPVLSCPVLSCPVL